MAETTAISWCHSTFNPWIGCTEVSTAASGGGGCDDCYARALDNRHRWGGATHWGAGVPRMRTSSAYWKQPRAWNRKAEASGQPWRVFCASLADVFDNEVPSEWRDDLWELVEETPYLTWLILTKRVGNVAKMMPAHLAAFTRNVWLGSTIVNQMEADRDVPKLLRAPAAVCFVSYEPALGPVDWTKFYGLDWIIVGGASRQRKLAPGFNLQWARDTITQAWQIGAAPFVKQLGSHVYDMPTKSLSVGAPSLKDRAGADPSEWPEELRVREFPPGITFTRVVRA